MDCCGGVHGGVEKMDSGGGAASAGVAAEEQFGALSGSVVDGVVLEM